MLHTNHHFPETAAHTDTQENIHNARKSVPNKVLSTLSYPVVTAALSTNRHRLIDTLVFMCVCAVESCPAWTEKGKKKAGYYSRSIEDRSLQLARRRVSVRYMLERVVDRSS